MACCWRHTPTDGAKATIFWVVTTHFQRGFCRACACLRRLSNEVSSTFRRKSAAAHGPGGAAGSDYPTGYRLQQPEFAEARVAAITDHDVIEDINAEEHAGGDEPTRQRHVVRTGCGIAAGMHVREDDRGGIAE